MARVARKVKDKRVLGLIRRYLQAGIMEEGLVSQPVQGTPQGGPLSPLLSNIMLDDLDKELDRRGHLYCRYADDCNIYVGSKRAGERVMESIVRFLGRRLRLKVNREKSAVDRPWKRVFLGFSMTWHKTPRIKVASSSVFRFKSNLKVAFSRGRGRNLRQFIEELKPTLKGWITYFVAAGIDSTGCGEHGRADMELGIRRIGAGKDFARGDEKAFLLNPGQRRFSDDVGLNAGHRFFRQDAPPALRRACGMAEPPGCKMAKPELKASWGHKGFR